MPDFKVRPTVNGEDIALVSEMGGGGPHDHEEYVEGIDGTQHIYISATKPADTVGVVGDICIPNTGTSEVTSFDGAVGFVNHGSNASMARPTTGFDVYIWRGTVQPTNMTADDMFWDVS